MQVSLNKDCAQKIRCSPKSSTCRCTPHYKNDKVRSMRVSWSLSCWLAFWMIADHFEFAFPVEVLGTFCMLVFCSHSRRAHYPLSWLWAHNHVCRFLSTSQIPLIASAWSVASKRLHQFVTSASTCSYFRSRYTWLRVVCLTRRKMFFDLRPKIRARFRNEVGMRVKGMIASNV